MWSRGVSKRRTERGDTNQILLLMVDVKVSDVGHFLTADPYLQGRRVAR